MDSLTQNLQIRKDLPKGFLNLSPKELYKLLSGPTLIHLKGKKDPPLFVSTLLHGNETTGLISIQRLLREHEQTQRPLLRSLIIFLGNVEAARFGQRKLDHQNDYNRIWSKPSLQDLDAAKQVIAYVQKEKIFACIDVHNTTGRNPFYACVTKFTEENVSLAQLFSRNIIFFHQPEGTITETISQFAPAVTIECGRSGNERGVECAKDFIETCLHFSKIPAVSSDKVDLNIYCSKFRILVPKDAQICFGSPARDSDFTFIEDFDKLNFTEVLPGTRIGWRHSSSFKLQVFNESGTNIADQFFEYRNGEILLAQKVIPSLFTTDSKVTKQDCLGYFLVPYPEKT